MEYAHSLPEKIPSTVITPLESSAGPIHKFHSKIEIQLISEWNCGMGEMKERK